MRWKLKAKIQNAVSLLPSSASYEAYYWMQRRFGGLRRIDPSDKLRAGIETWERIQKQGSNPAGKVFFEVGTGRTPLLPLALWLMGAAKSVTVDLNPYLKEELLAEGLRHISRHEEEVAALFGPLLDRERFGSLLKLVRGAQPTLAAVLELCRVEYLAPGDAGHVPLPDGSVDFHTSYTVFEHIPPKELEAILREGNRIVRKSGLFIHRIDYSDHFSHSDSSISQINFLQYDDRAWGRYADNRYMYMNRLRHDDFLELFRAVGHTVLEAETIEDRRARELLQSRSFPLDRRFSRKTEAVLATTGAWVISRQKSSP